MKRQWLKQEVDVERTMMRFLLDLRRAATWTTGSSIVSFVEVNCDDTLMIQLLMLVNILLLVMLHVRWYYQRGLYDRKGTFVCGSASGIALGLHNGIAFASRISYCKDFCD
jgi:hypothetical protein